MKKQIISGLFFILTLAAVGFAQGTSNFSEQVKLSADDEQLFKEKSQRKVNELLDHITVLGDKAQTAANRESAEKEALKLFYVGAIMETSVIKPDGSVDIKQRPMSDYFYRLKTLPYVKVKIEFFDLCYVQSFTLGPDGKYYGTATVFQKFTGYTGDNMIYTDVVKKEISIIIENINDEFYNERRWEIFLGDIKAAETKSS